MSKGSTQRVSVQLVYAREQGIIPWEWIVDETREAERIPQWRDLERFAAIVQRSYRRDRWNDQPRRIEVWSEKGTVRGTLGPVLNRYGVTFRVMHGFSSATTVYEAAQEVGEQLVLYVGDWDPSGLYMSELDLPERLVRYGSDIELRREALTLPDIGDGSLPHFEAATKRKDPGFKRFVSRYGARCWELDAMDPVELRCRVQGAIEAEIDMEYWRRCERVELAERESLKRYMEGWTSASD